MDQSLRKSGALEPSEALRSYLKDAGVTQKQFAERIGSQQSIISRILAKDIRPGIDLAYSIEVETGGYVKTTQWARLATAATNSERTAAASPQ